LVDTASYNYKDAALDKYLRELKYLTISDKLIFETAKFWMNFWKNETNEETCFVCYYIDGNTKPLWSSNSCYKGKVTMLGRVMNCLENVFIHDGKGHPIYFQTFHGHADIGKHALNIVHKLTQMLDNPSAHIQVNRIIVFDAGGNGVQTLRGFNDSEEYFITILDENQTKDRKFKKKQLETQYKYGNAKLIDCQIELIDSDEKNYIYESRAVIVNWDNGRKAVIITDIPCELLDDPDAICLKECESNINRCIRQKAKINKEHKDDFDKLKTNVEEEKRIRDKDKVYRIDTELDQIMTCFKMSFVNLCSFFLIKCFDSEKFELLTLMESIFQLDGNASFSSDRKVIDIEMNPKEPDLMNKLYKGLQILNTMQVDDLERRGIEFKV
jgi:hypothetical protein